MADFTMGVEENLPRPGEPGASAGYMDMVAAAAMDPESIELTRMTPPSSRSAQGSVSTSIKLASRSPPTGAPPRRWPRRSGFGSAPSQRTFSRWEDQGSRKDRIRP